MRGSFWWDPDLGNALSEIHQAGRFASVSDILRVSILRAEGGLYVDTDVLPMALDRQSVPTGIGLVMTFNGDRVKRASACHAYGAAASFGRLNGRAIGFSSALLSARQSVLDDQYEA